MTDTITPVVTFECPEGTRLIVQRPDGYMTAMVEGRVHLTTTVELNDENPALDSITGAHIETSLSCTGDPARDGSLWTVAAGEYPFEEAQR